MCRPPLRSMHCTVYVACTSGQACRQVGSIPCAHDLHGPLLRHSCCMCRLLVRLMHCTAFVACTSGQACRQEGRIPCAHEWHGPHQVCKGKGKQGRCNHWQKRAHSVAVQQGRSGNAPRRVRLMRRQRDQALEGQEHAGRHVLCQLVPVRHLDLCCPAQAWVDTRPGSLREHAGRRSQCGCPNQVQRAHQG